MFRLTILKCDKTFILVDCGGGTTDTGSFRVSKDYPLRINEEVNRALGKLNTLNYSL